jgi:hypothetical protein
MSTNVHKSDVVILVVLGVVSAMLITALVGWERLGRQEDATPGLRTTRSTNVDGMAVCYTLFERLGVTVNRMELPFSAESLDAADVLWIVDTLLAIRGTERAALADWVRRGGVLACTASVGCSLKALHGVELPACSPCSGGTCQVAAATRPAVSRRQGDFPLARDVEFTEFATDTAIDVDVREPPAAPDSPEVLFADADGPRVVALTVGEGRVIVMADSSFLANGWLGRRQNAVLAVNLIAYCLEHAGGARVGFDEYHFGYGRHETGWSVLAAMLWHSSPGWAVLSLTVSGILLLLYKGRRFGTRRHLVRPQRRSKLEYVHAVGATYRAAGAHGLVLKLILQGFRQRAAAALRLPPAASLADIANALSRRSGRPLQRYMQPLRRCEQAVETGRLGARWASSLLAQLAKVEAEVLDGHASSR